MAQNKTASQRWKLPPSVAAASPAPHQGLAESRHQSGLNGPPEPLNDVLTKIKVSDKLRPIHGSTLRRGIDTLLMSWTTERPKSVGVYWHRATPASLSHPVKIYSVGSLFYVWPIEEDRRADVTVRLDDCSGEWAGPMLPPCQ